MNGNLTTYRSPYRPRISNFWKSFRSVATVGDVVCFFILFGNRAARLSNYWKFRVPIYWKSKGLRGVSFQYMFHPLEIWWSRGLLEGKISNEWKMSSFRAIRFPINGILLVISFFLSAPIRLDFSVVASGFNAKIKKKWGADRAEHYRLVLFVRDKLYFVYLFV